MGTQLKLKLKHPASCFYRGMPCLLNHLLLTGTNLPPALEAEGADAEARETNKQNDEEHHLYSPPQSQYIKPIATRSGTGSGSGIASNQKQKQKLFKADTLERLVQLARQ